MVATCCVVNCTNHHSAGCGISFLRFPADGQQPLISLRQFQTVQWLCVFYVFRPSHTLWRARPCIFHFVSSICPHLHGIACYQVRTVTMWCWCKIEQIDRVHAPDTSMLSGLLNFSSKFPFETYPLLVALNIRADCSANMTVISLGSSKWCPSYAHAAYMPPSCFSCVLVKKSVLDVRVF